MLAPPPTVKTLYALLFTLLLAAALPLHAQTTVRAQKPFELYAQFLQDTRVELSDGAVWMMDKGDCFPVYMFKDHQTKVVLKLASATFQVDASNLKVLSEAENEAALVSYRKNLAQFLNKQPDIWTKEAKTAKDTTKKKKQSEAEKK
jgi:hypothetical protein